jgi:DNA-binding MarR family transcriptional regulator
MPHSDPAQRDPIHEARRQWIAHGWDDAADGMAMVTSLVRVQQLLMERINAALRPCELTFARFEVLRLLAFTKAGELTMTRLGSLLQVHPTSVTSAVDRLVAQGFVDRVRGDADRRVIRARITDSGRAIVETATVALNDQVFAEPGLGADDVRRLTALMDSLRSVSGDEVGRVTES